MIKNSSFLFSFFACVFSIVRGGGLEIEILNPYEHVNWSWTHHRANLHTHTTQSDGDFDPAVVIDEYHSRGYTILSLTDHDRVTYPWTPWANPNSLGMLAVQGNELSGIGQHVGGYFIDYQFGMEDLPHRVRQIGMSGGIAVPFHPGLGRSNSYPPEDYVEVFRANSHAVGIEIVNQNDSRPNDRILWDMILTELMPERPVWGFCNDDMHRAGQFELSWNMFPLQQLTLENFRAAMENGEFYSVTNSVTRSTSGSHADVPSIQSITVVGNTITINASGAEDIVWISGVTGGGAKNIIHTGPTLDVDAHAFFQPGPSLPGYVRAEISNNRGTVFTNPFGLRTRAGPVITSTPSITRTTVHQPYSYAITTVDRNPAGSGGTYTFTVPTGLPPGMSLNTTGATTAELSGSPTSPGRYDIRLVVSDGTFSQEQEFSLLVVTADAVEMSPLKVIDHGYSDRDTCLLEEVNFHRTRAPTAFLAPEWQNPPEQPRNVAQGLAANLEQVDLDEEGDYVEILFRISGNFGANRSEAVRWGLFNGNPVDGHYDVSSTDGWQGYLHVLGSADGNRINGGGAARQGSGSQGVLSHVLNDMNFNGATVTASLPPVYSGQDTEVRFRVERINATQLQVTSTYDTPRGNQTNSGSGSGISWSYQSQNGVSVFESVHTASQGPTSFNGFAIVSRGDPWMLEVLEVRSNALGETVPPPPAPTGLSSTAVGPNQINLSWTDPTDPSDPTDSFRIERSSDGSSGWTLLDTVTEPQYSDTGLSGGSTWYYRVFAQRAGVSSPASTVVNATTPQVNTPPQITQPPQSLTVAEGGTATFSVEASGYPTPGYQWRKDGTHLSGETDHTLVISNVTPAHAGSYTVFVSNSVGNVESPSAELVVTPPAPTGLSATADGMNRIELTWSYGSDPSDSFRVERSADGSSGWTVLETVTETQYSDTGLTGGSTWYYRVIAVRGGLESPPSASASATTDPEPFAPVITQQPQSQTVFEGSGVTFTVVADGFPTPTYQWRKDGTDLTGQTAASLTLSDVAFEDAGDYTVLVYNGENPDVESVPATLTVNPAPLLAIGELYRINEGTVSESEGSYTLTRTGEDTLQGYASNFADLELLEVGDYVQLSFVIKPRDSGNVTNRAVSWGFFQGSLVSDHAQTGITDLWQGYFHQIATRNSDGTSGMGVFRQGQGPVGLMDYAGGGTEVNGASATQNVVPIHPTNFAEVTLRLEKISETHIRLSSHYETPGGTNRSGSGLESGITWNYSVAAPASGSGANVATLNATYPLEDGPVSFNGFAIASIGDNWVLRDLSIESNVITEPPPVQPATVTFSDLIQTADGEPRSPTVTTDPPALAYSITFDGSPAAPAASGIYQVLATVTEEGYEGSATDVFRLLTPEGIVDSSGSGADDEWEMEVFGNLEDEPVLIQGQAFTRRQVFFWGLEAEPPFTQVFKLDGMNFSTVSGRMYQIQFREHLTEGEWADHGEPFEGNGQARQVEDAQPGFYRVRVMLP